MQMRIMRNLLVAGLGLGLCITAMFSFLSWDPVDPGHAEDSGPTAALICYICVVIEVWPRQSSFWFSCE